VGEPWRAYEDLPQRADLGVHAVGCGRPRCGGGHGRFLLDGDQADEGGELDTGIARVGRGRPQNEPGSNTSTNAMTKAGTDVQACRSMCW